MEISKARFVQRVRDHLLRWHPRTCLEVAVLKQLPPPTTPRHCHHPTTSVLSLSCEIEHSVYIVWRKGILFTLIYDSSPFEVLAGINTYRAIHRAKNDMTLSLAAEDQVRSRFAPPLSSLANGRRKQSGLYGCGSTTTSESAQHLQFNGLDLATEHNQRTHKALDLKG